MRALCENQQGSTSHSRRQRAQDNTSYIQSQMPKLLPKTNCYANQPPSPSADSGQHLFVDHAYPGVYRHTTEQHDFSPCTPVSES